MKLAALGSIDFSQYVPHELHRPERTWVESNCYIDVWIEVLHAMNCDPYACFGFVLGADWEGDQFTFLKPPHEDLVTLYGLDVQELTVYKPLLDHVCEQLRLGKLVLTEADAFFLPDTAGTDYRTQHTKTTIGIQAVDVDARALGYFHNSSYYVLENADFVGFFRLDLPTDSAFLPLFAELVRTSRVKMRETGDLVGKSIELLKKHLARRPPDNPIRRFSDQFHEDLERLQAQGLPAYHAYAFASIRQLGAAFELGALYLGWLGRHGERGLDESAADFAEISTASKSLILKAARAVGAQKAVDVCSILSEIESRWDGGMGRLARRYSI